MKRRTCILSLIMLLSTTGIISAQDKPIIMIDPGHGGEQAGVEADGLLEKDVVLRAGFALAAEFVSRGYDVRLTRTGDYDVGFADRRKMAEDAGAAMFISLHFNGDEDLSKHGIEIYADLDDPVRTDAANKVAEALRRLDTPVVVEARPWDFIKSPTVPTLMIEAGFLTHPVERRLLLSSAYHHELAAKMADGVIAFLEADK